MADALHRCWAILGIALTRDQRAIRTAYSARLKAVDPDVDPQAFIALREAFEAAKAEAAWIGADIAASVDDDSELAEGIAHPPAAGDSFPRPAAEPDRVDVHARAIMAIIHGPAGDTPWLADAPRAAMLDHWKAIAADPRMAEIGFFGDVERWAANVIADGAPRSSSLIVPATQLFNWLAHEGRLAQSDAAWEVVRLYRLRAIVDRATWTNDPRHPAWIELTTRAYPGSNRGRTDPLAVYELLTAVRQAWPEVEAHFDPLRVALWKNNTAAPDSYESRVARGEQPRPRWVKWVFFGWIGLSLFIGLLKAIGGQ